jgi:hypothetical protein
LSEDERAELVRLRRENAELVMEPMCSETCGIAREPDCSADGKPHDSVTLSPEQDRQTKKRYPG